MTYIVSALLGYLIGSIPFGLVLCKAAGYGDVRKIGSGNIGATNVLRTGNKPLALATLILDSGKGAIAVVISYFLASKLLTLSASLPADGLCQNIETGALMSCGPESAKADFYVILVLAGFAAILGHCYPIWLKFKGGKGVATTLGTLLAAVPFTGVMACLVWLAMALTFKISSLSALVAMIVAPIVTFLVYGAAPAFVCLLITALVFWKHRENIKRLRNGEEPKINFKKKDQDASSA